CHDEMHMDAGEDLRLGSSSVGVHLDNAILYRFTTLFEDMDHIVGRASAGPDQHKLHGAWTGLWLGVVRTRSSSEHHLMAGSGLSDKGSILNPFHSCFQGIEIQCSTIEVR